MDIGSLTVDEFLSRLGSSDPTPGGGSLAALTGAMAAAMLAMVCNLTMGRPRYADVEAQVQRILGDATARQQRLVDLSNQDAAAYAAVRDAYRLPRSDDDERAARSDAIEESMHGASEVPVQTAEAARFVLDLATEAAEIMNVTVLGDVAVAAHVALAAARSAADQADLNLSTLGDEAFVSSLRSRLTHALDGGDRIVERTVETVRRRAAV